MNVPSDSGQDHADIGEGNEALYLASELLRIRRMVFAFPDEECLNCEAQLEQHRQRFCNPECAADWTNRMSIKGRQWSA